LHPLAFPGPLRPSHISHRAVLSGSSGTQCAPPRSKVFWPERTLNLLRFNFLGSLLLLLCMAAGCQAQSTPPGPLDANLTRRVEVLVRSQYNLPPDYAVAVGTPQPGNIAGYNMLPITISHTGKSQVVDFLISTDNT